MFDDNNPSPIFFELKELTAPVSDLKSISALLGWDQETNMPQGGLRPRSDQISTADTLVHQILISDKASRIAEKIKSGDFDQSEYEKSLCRIFLRDHERAVKIPSNLVSKISAFTSRSLESWKKAREANDFSIFEPELNELLCLKMQEAECLGYESNPYDAMLDEFEPEMTEVKLRPIFDKLCNQIADILGKIQIETDAPECPGEETLFSRDQQFTLARFISKKMGFDFSYGRMDESMHPFTTAFGSYDVRFTMHPHENDYRRGLFAAIHETGHALYEQGISSDLYRTPAAGGASFGIHESQSLIWENNIARSLPFCKLLAPYLTEYFPQLGYCEPQTLYRLFNRVKPGHIRVEADELTYNFHILLRFEIELGLFRNELDTKDIPAVWNEKMQEYLGIKPPDDSRGCLQDIHWSAGAFGYFPSYTLGKLYAAMIWNQLNCELGNTDTLIESGELATIRQWLKDNIHQYGALFTPEELIKRVCGKKPSETDFISYINAKIDSLY